MVGLGVVDCHLFCFVVLSSSTSRKVARREAIVREDWKDSSRSEASKFVESLKARRLDFNSNWICSFSIHKKDGNPETWRFGSLIPSFCAAGRSHGNSSRNRWLLSRLDHILISYEYRFSRKQENKDKATACTERRKSGPASYKIPSSSKSDRFVAH